jgi:putative DNA primase/helicase
LTPTLLIDEADTFIRNNNKLKGLINAGHTRSSAFALRTVGENHEAQKFKTWGPKAFAGITLEKHFSDATMSRGLVINMRRKMPHESTARLRHAESGLFEVITSKLARFANDYSQQVQMARPVLPEELSDRAQDNWEPLLAIAECAGTEWVQRATAAALKLSSASESSVSTGNELLADIQEVFQTKRVDKISTADLIEALTKDNDEMPWSTYNRGKPMTPRQLAKQLGAYDIKSRTVRSKNGTPKGYYAADFKDAFARYLSPKVPLLPDTEQHFYKI